MYDIKEWANDKFTMKASWKVILYIVYFTDKQYLLHRHLYGLNKQIGDDRNNGESDI